MTRIISYEEFFREQYTSLVALGTWLTGSRSIGEDLAQDALNATHDRWGEVSRYERPGTFSRRAVINLASNERRRRGREHQALRRLSFVRGEPTDPGANTQESSLPDPIWAEVAALPFKQRAAVALRYLDDLSTDQIAAALECSEATVRVHLHRAHRRLADRLGTTSTTAPAPTQKESSR